MINTIVNLKITKLRELSTLSVDREYLTVDYLDENGEEQRIEKLTHEEDLGEYNVKTDLWADILEDWRLTKPIPVPSAEKEDWKLLEDYLWNLSDSRYQELLDNRNKLYEADDVANILRNTRIASLQEKLSRCVKGSKRWRKLDAKRRRIEAKTSDALRNADHQTTRKVSDFIQEHDAGRIVAGDVRGIEQNTRKNETRRVRNRKDQRRRLSQWSRGRQESLLAHKTSMTIEHIDESWSSKTCPACQTRNHPNGRGYHCRNCGFHLQP